MESNSPATSGEAAVPATTGGSADAGDAAVPAASAVAVPATTELLAPVAPAVRRPRQNVAAGLFPIVLALLVLLFVGLGMATILALTGGGT